MTELLGNLGDFIGGIGVIVTVIYLAMQIRTNTLSTQTSTYQSVVGALSDWSFTLARDKEMMRIMSVGMADRTQLDAAEVSQFNMLLVSLMRHYEGIHFQYLNGFISADAWEGWSSRIRGTLVRPGVLALWEEQKGAFSPAFRRFLEVADPSQEAAPVPVAF